MEKTLGTHSSFGIELEFVCSAAKMEIFLSSSTKWSMANLPPGILLGFSTPITALVVLSWLCSPCNEAMVEGFQL